MPTPEQIQKMFAPLLPGLMGIELTEATQDKVVATMLVRPDLCTVGGVCHGGAFMAFADTIGAIGTVMNLPPGTRTTTIESKTNFLGAAPVNTRVTAESTPASPRQDHPGLADDDPLGSRQAVRRRHPDADGAAGLTSHPRMPRFDKLTTCWWRLTASRACEAAASPGAAGSAPASRRSAIRRCIFCSSKLATAVLPLTRATSRT